MNINNRLHYLRNTLNLTTRAFAETINMTGGAVSNMENGQRNITQRTINDICRVHNVNKKWIIDGEEPIFNDVVKDLNVASEVKVLANQYNLLTDRDKLLVRNIIDSLLEKTQQKKDE